MWLSYKWMSSVMGPLTARWKNCHTSAAGLRLQSLSWEAKQTAVALTFYFRIKCGYLMKAIAVPACTCLSNPLVSCFLFCHSMILALINDWEVEKELLAAKLGHHSCDWLWSGRHLANVPRSVSSCSIFFLFEQEVFFCIFNIKYFQKTLDLCSSCFCSFTTHAAASVRWNPCLQNWSHRN